MAADPHPPVGLLVSAVGRSVARGFRAALGPLGLDPRQYLLLRAIGACRDQSQHAVGTSLQIPPSRMVVLVDALEARHLVERVANPLDRRAHALRLTGAGGRLLERATELAEAYDREVCRSLDQAEQDLLVGLLGRLTGR